MITALGFLAVLLASYVLAFHLAPAAFRLLARLLRVPVQPNPLTEKRLRRFRSIGRGYYAFVLITTLFVASLFLELYVNARPLYIRYGETVRYPAVADWFNFVIPTLGRNTELQSDDFGLETGGPLDSRLFATWVRDPATLDEDAREIHREIERDQARFHQLMKEQASRKGLSYDPATPLPESKLAEYEEQRQKAAALVALQEELQGGKAAVVMPLYPYSPTEQLLELPGSPPHQPFQKGLPVLGTDFGGRDVLSQLLYGFRIGLSFALAVTLVGYAFGVALGGAMGYFGGWFDIAVQRVIEIWSSMPFFFIVMILASVMSPSFWSLVFLLVVLHAWVGITYTMRGEFYRESARDYVQAARALGARPWPIMVRHILPNAMVPIVTLLPFALVGEMATLVALDYLGFGLPPGTPSWGALLRQGSENIVNHPQLVYIPVAAFAGTLLCVVLIGEAVREAFDPKQYARLR